MDCYLSKILELGLDEGDEVNLSEKQTKEIINQKIQQTSQIGKKRKRGAKQQFNNGMTEEEMIAEQKRLFEKAKLYEYEDDSDDQMEQQQLMV